MRPGRASKAGRAPKVGGGRNELEKAKCRNVVLPSHCLSKGRGEAFFLHGDTLRREPSAPYGPQMPGEAGRALQEHPQPWGGVRCVSTRG